MGFRKGLLRGGEILSGSRGKVLSAPEVFVTTVTKGFEEVAEREIYRSKSSLGVDPGTGV